MDLSKSEPIFLQHRPDHLTPPISFRSPEQGEGIFMGTYLPNFLKQERQMAVAICLYSNKSMDIFELFLVSRFWL